MCEPWLCCFELAACSPPVRPACCLRPARRTARRMTADKTTRDERDKRKGNGAQPVVDVRARTPHSHFEHSAHSSTGYQPCSTAQRMLPERGDALNPPRAKNALERLVSPP